MDSLIEAQLEAIAYRINENEFQAVVIFSPIPSEDLAVKLANHMVEVIARDMAKSKIMPTHSKTDTGYMHNPKKKKHKYHIASSHGTLCKLENSDVFIGQVYIETPPAGKKLCQICADMERHILQGNPVLTKEVMLTTIIKLFNGVKPGDERWSKDDQACLDAAYGI